MTIDSEFGGSSQAAGEQLRRARQAANLSQEDLAADADITQSRLSKLERLGPAAGWMSFCAVAKELGFVVEVTLRKSVDG